MPRESSKTKDEVARGADVPLALAAVGPRDALLDPRDTDIIPDLETKGLHVGEVAQPAEPVLHRSGDVTFESLPEAPESRFPKELSFKEQKRLNSEMQANDPAYAGRPFVGDADPEADRLARATYREPVRDVETGTSRSTATSKLDRESAAVASKQATEDRS